MIGEKLVKHRHRTQVTRYESAEEFAEAANKRRDREKGTVSIEEDRRTSFTGVATYEEAHRMATLTGWPEGRAKIEALTGNLVASLAGRIMREDWIPDVEGNYVDL